MGDDGMRTTYRAMHTGPRGLGVDQVPNGHVARPSRGVTPPPMSRPETGSNAGVPVAQQDTEQVAAVLRGKGVIPPSAYIVSAAGKAALARSGLRAPRDAASLNSVVEELGAGDDSAVGYFSRTAQVEDSRLGGSLLSYAATSDAWEAALAAGAAADDPVASSSASQPLGTRQAAADVQQQISQLKDMSTRPLLKAGRPTMLSTYDVTFNKDDAMAANIAAALDVRLTARRDAEAAMQQLHVPPPAAPTYASASASAPPPPHGAGPKPTLSASTRHTIIRNALAEDFGPELADAVLPANAC